ncbi:thioesterase II family protein [Alteromonas sp. a30]|uniref:thioesterase II family protein n=1 Tax=Alteromonas sp. a30 TaxID=2730917 RepID=UPI002281EAB6|nr:alpha/beta fold hydrolase [Alteromonas sp. a30]MCY7296759.1 thioesterase [Alteromonas sp. a30]
MSNNWFVVSKPRPQAQLRLICFPYAGGNANTFGQWSDTLYNNVEVVAIQPPGRANRLSEPAFDNMQDLVDALMQHFPSVLDKPYMLFGHSMGARVAFEVLLACVERDLPLPKHFIASGSRAVQIPDLDKLTTGLSDDAFIERLRDLEGTPEVLLQNAELMELFLPLLRAEFTLSESYRFEGDVQLDVPLTVFGGVEDSGVDKDRLLAWQQHFVPEMNLSMFPGGHFFLEHEQKLVLERLNQIFTRYFAAN